MNPRHRRLLIPGLLIALIAIVVLASMSDTFAAHDAQEPQRVSVIDDPRITEASGMAVSRRDRDLAYLTNDSGNAQQIYAVQISSGRVVGTTDVTGAAWRDPEALAIDRDGTLWVADTGDNRNERDDSALFSLPEPGRGNQTVGAVRYPVNYGGTRYDVEALALNPRTGELFIVTKALVGGTVFVLPARLATDRINVAKALPGTVLPVTTDATFSSDGRRVYLLSALGHVAEYRAERDSWSWSRNLGRVALRQPETLAITADSRALLVGTEGRPSPLMKLNVPVPDRPRSKVDQPAEPTPPQRDDGASQDRGERPMALLAGAVAVAGVGLAGAAWLRTRTRR